MSEETEIKKEIKLAKINEAYHRQQMEYYQEEIEILEDELNDED